MSASRIPQLAGIQSLRGLAVLMVLAFHLRVLEDKWGGGERLLPDALYLGAAGVDLFFVISGFIMAAVTRGSFGAPAAAGRFLANRAIRIYPLYWLYSLAVLALYLARPQMVNASQGNSVDLVASFLLLPQAQLPLLMVAWTLVFEMYFYCVFAALLLLPERLVGAALCAWAAATVAASLLFSFPGSEFSLSLAGVLTSTLTLEFIAGCALGRLVLAHGFTRHAPLALALAAGGFALGFWVHAGLPRAEGGLVFDAFGVPAGWLRVLLFGLPAAALVYGAAALEHGRGTALLPGLRGIGDASYSLYLSHLLVLAALGRLWQPLAVPGAWDNLAWIALAAGAALLWGLASYRLVERPLLAKTRAGMLRIAPAAQPWRKAPAGAAR